jgi:hypothetical protein
MLALVFGLYLLVPTWIQYPLDLFVTFVHESGHALAALVTGGQVASLVVDPNGAGVTYTAGGTRFLILCGGYLGVTLFGTLLLRLNTIPNIRVYVLESLAAVITALTLYYGGDSFTWAVGLGMASILALIGLKTNPQVEYLTVNFLGIYTGLGALKDLGILWKIQNGAARLSAAGSHGVSDAEALGAYTGLPANIWVILWVGLSLALLGHELYRASKLK